MGLISTLFCMFALLPSPPPGVFLFGGWFQLYPIRRDQAPCNEIDSDYEVRFRLYQGNDEKTYKKLSPYDDNLLELSNFNGKLPTVVYIHGFLDGPESEEVIVTKQAYMKKGGHNLIVVDWEKLAAGPWYLTARANVKPVGQHVSKLLDFLNERSGPLESLHLIGHSLGAHIASVAATNTHHAKIQRITGLDPALPMIDLSTYENRLDSSDAPFVDVIHTDGQRYGINTPIGHVDFYPNSGKGTQPGCGFFEIPFSYTLLQRIFCSHHKSFKWYAETVLNQQKYIATKCDSWINYSKKQCEGEEQVPLGYSVPTSAKGSYYLKI